MEALCGRDRSAGTVYSEAMLRTAAGSSLDVAFEGKLAEWCGRRGVSLGVLFGSQARGAARPESDVDLALWLPQPPSARELLAWRRELTDALGSPVQLVLVTPRLDPVLGFQIARHGTPVFEAPPGAWAGERLRLWHAYNDAMPFLRAARRRLRDFAAEHSRGS
jgi:predicted nucleotidyltransferase